MTLADTSPAPTLTSTFAEPCPIRPLNDAVAIRRLERDTDERRSEGGIVLTDLTEREPGEGIVVALGDGFVEACPDCQPQGRRYAFGVAIGQRVLFPPWLATSVILGDVEYMIVADRDIIGVVD